MTKERKLEILKDLLIQLSDSANILCTCEADERCEVVEECIKTLEQQPSEDCISRAEVQKFVSYIQSIKDSHNEENTPINYGTICDLVIRGWKLMELPPVTPTQSWILIERRELTQEEKEFYSSLYGDEPEYMIESRMPDDGEEVLVSAGGIVFLDIFSHDEFDFEKISVDEIDAWMPLPQPYEDKGGNEDGSN